MNYGQIRKYDIANGPGIRTSIFVTGCNLNCENCFNKAYQDPNYGNIWTDETSLEVIGYLSDPNVSGLTVLGGEPFENAEDLCDILLGIKAYIDKEIWIYSGYTYEHILKDPNKLKLLSLCDVLVDGPFIEDEKDLTLKFRGSKNQRVIDIKKSLANNSLELMEIYN